MENMDVHQEQKEGCTNIDSELQMRCNYMNQVIAKVNDMVRNQQNPQHMVGHAVAWRLKLNCLSNVSRAVGVQLPQDLPLVLMPTRKLIKSQI